MKRENLFTLLLALLVVIALFQTFQLTGLKGKITSNVVQNIELPSEQPPAPQQEPTLDAENPIKPPTS